MAQIYKEKTDDFNALLQNWIGMLVRCEKETGKAFTAKLISIKGNHLLFEDINGRILMDSITSLKTAAPITPSKNAAEWVPMDPKPLTTEELEDTIRDCIKDRCDACPFTDEEVRTCVENGGVSPCEGCEGPEEAAARARKGL